MAGHAQAAIEIRVQVLNCVAQSTSQAAKSGGKINKTKLNNISLAISHHPYAL